MESFSLLLVDSLVIDIIRPPLYPSMLHIVTL